MEQVIPIKTHDPGLVSEDDVAATLNTGSMIFKNFSVKDSGKLVKRRGWEVPIGAIQGGPIFGLPYVGLEFGDKTGINCISTYATDFFYQFRPDILYTRVKKVTEGSDEVKYLDVIYHRRKGINGAIAHRRINLNTNANVFDRDVTPSGSAPGSYPYIIDGWGPVLIIPTDDNLYIINSYTKGTDGRAVKKYNLDLTYGEIGTHAQNVTLQRGTQSVRAELGETHDNLTPGLKYRYKIVPVYNTGTRSDAETNPDDQLEYEVPIADGKCPSIQISKNDYTYRNPYVTHYRIYRTHGGATQDFVNEFWMKKARDMKFVKQFAEILEEYDATKYYFLDQLEKPANPDDDDWIKLYDDYIVKDDYLGSLYVNNNYTNISNDEPKQTELFHEGNGVDASCGAYIHNRMIVGGDPKNPQILQLTDLNKTDAYNADIAYRIPTASLTNMMTAVLEVGPVFFVFCKYSTDMFTETQNADAPYVRENKSKVIGCDSAASAVSFGGVGYFMFKNKLYAINEYGIIKLMSARINSEFDDIVVDNGSFVTMKVNEGDQYIKIMFREEGDTVKNIDYYPLLDMFCTSTGERDTFDYATSALSLNEQVEDAFALMGYHYNPDLKREYCITKYGDFMSRDVDSPFTDTSYVDKITVWPNYTYSGSAPTAAYNVKGIKEQAVKFVPDCTVKAVKLYGNGDIKFKYSYNGGSYTEEKTWTMNKTKGVTIPIGFLCTLFRWQLIHDTAEQIDFDYMEIIVEAETKVSVQNVSAGS